MKKYSIVIILILSLLLNGALSLEIMAVEVTDEMQRAYDEMILLRSDWGIIYSIHDFDIDIWNEYKVLVKKIPGTFPSSLAGLKEPDGSPNSYNREAGEYRYIGKNPDGYLVNNPKYPDDHSGSAVINTYDWQENADKKTRIYQYINKPEDQAFYEKEIFHFLEQEYGPRFDETEDPSGWLDNAIVIVPASSTGSGVIKYMHKWDSNKDGVAEEWYITVNLRAMEDVIEEITQEEEEDRVDIPSSQLDSQATAVIQADPRDNEAFDASVAVPASDPLYVQIQGMEYLHALDYQHVYGTKNYSVTVSRRYKLVKGVKDKETGEVRRVSRTTTRSKTYAIPRTYDFYRIENLSVFALDQGIVTNEALPGGQHTLQSSVKPPQVVMERGGELQEHIIDPVSDPIVINLPQKTLGSKSRRSYPSIPNENFRPTAEAAVGQIRVKNDGLIFNGEVLLDNGLYETKTPVPRPIPPASLNSTEDLYQGGLHIPATMSNGLKPSEGELVYKTVIDTRESNGRREAIEQINDVTVHTPVVCYPVLDAISKQTQQLTYDPEPLQLVIGERFHIDYPKKGQHMEARGYGDRDYSAYFEVKQVAFPFDVYVGTGYDGLYFPKNTWGNFNSLEATFFIPAWERELEGEIMFRSIPINHQDILTDPYEYYANRDITKYKAVESMAFKLSSKLYDFQVTACPDDYWTDHVSKEAPYRAIDLPIKPKDTRRVGTPKEGIMLGYPIVFDVRTNGDLYHPEDTLSIEPYYTYVPVRNGVADYSQRQAVDVYVSRYDQVVAFEGKVTLTAKDRIFIGDTSWGPTSMDQGVKKRSVQQWKGRFHLPNMAYFLPKGTDITRLGHINLGADPFLHDGYIVVGFKMVVHKQGKGAYLGYNNGWTEEGFKTRQGMETYQLGDIAIYSSSRRASQTYR